MNPEYVRQIINLTQSTSASYLLMASLDISRRNLALRGKESFEKVIELSEYARREINAIGGYYAYSKELIDGVSVCDFDVTKLSVYTQGIGLTGIGFMTSCETNTTFRSSLVISAISWPIFLSATASKTSSAWLVLWLILRDSIQEMEKI